jgi:hypothetical protein
MSNIGTVPNSLAQTSYFRKASRVNVVSLLIQKTGTYNEQALRPYVTNPNLNNREIGALATSIADAAAGGNFDPMSVSNVSSSFLTRSAVPDSIASVPNGWVSERARFFMKVNVTLSTGHTSTLFITGYTDVPGITTVNIDPSMVFYPNSVTLARNQTVNTPFGAQNNVAQIGTQQIFIDSGYDHNMGAFAQRQLLMRPTDIFNNIGNEFLTAGADSFGIDKFSPTSFMDSRLSVDSRGKTGSKNLNTSSRYLADIVNSYVNTIQNDDGIPKAPHEAAYTTYMSLYSSEQKDVVESEFFNLLNQHKGYYGGNSLYFTFKDLQALDPNIDNITTVMNSEPGAFHRAGQTQHWHGSDLSTVAASILASSVPALMVEQLISRISFKSTNDTINAQPLTVILGGNSLSNNQDITSNYERFKLLFEALVLKDISYNNQIGYYVEMNVDLTGETWIKIKIGNDPVVDYVSPTFCDSLFSPLITTKRENVNNVTSDLETLATYIKDATFTPTTSNSPTIGSGFL